MVSMRGLGAGCPRADVAECRLDLARFEMTVDAVALQTAEGARVSGSGVEFRDLLER